MTRTITSARPLAVFDLDGTLAETGHRQHFLERKPRDWKGFFGALHRDPPLAEGVRLVREATEDCEVVYLTGRPERCRRETLEWLARHGLPEGRLCMRGDADRRPARAMKLEAVRDLHRRREVRVVVDDDELVCDAVERAGFRVVRARWASTSQQESTALRDAQERDGRT
ncbi:phosphatase domain-containing protein [Streptacidiphilus neutrinimicus]|uniref:phosphatase domain-containing protein n=1 Tax=Streptacidiphilus neutrinimicus TaxID=105420 RepID=UPI0005A78DC0|nr:nucleotidase [Streptacidiphilus neutrinimicus]